MSLEEGGDPVSPPHHGHHLLHCAGPTEGCWEALCGARRVSSTGSQKGALVSRGLQYAFSRPSCPHPPRFCVSLWTVRSSTCGLVPIPHPLVSPAWPLVTLLNLSSTHWIVKVARSQMLTRTLLFPSTGPPGFWGKGRIKTCDKPLFRNCDFGANRPDSILAGLTFKGVQAFILSCGASVGPFSTQR